MKLLLSCLRYTLVLAALPLAGQVTFNTLPSREIGQYQLLLPPTSGAPNLVEGREFELPQSLALDTSVTPPILYVADTVNNRVLAWKNATAFTSGAPAADLVIGQRDQYSTLLEGPGTQLTTGLSRPTAVAVDKNGNLYVADAGNNRIVRYPQPFTNAAGGGLLPIDLVIGQKGPGTGSSPNEGTGTPSAKTISLGGNTIFQSSLVFDAQGNLYVADAGNNRVLRFPVGQLAPNTVEPNADLVLGQFDFVSNKAVQTQGQTPAQQRKDGMAAPAGLAFDQTGRLYVCDVYNRVLMYTPPFVNGSSASRILGILPSPTPPVPITSQAQLYQLYGNSLLGLWSFNNGFSLNSPPSAVFTIGNTPFVVDTGNNRIVRYDSPDQWPPETPAAMSPVEKAVFGQSDFTKFLAHGGTKIPSAGTFNTPVAAVFDGTELFVVDAGNNRVLALPLQGANGFGSATRLLGQDDFTHNAENLIEGKELYFADPATGLLAGGGMAVDTTSTPPHLYIADTFNNRVLGFKDARAVTAGTPADIVIGQVDLFSSLQNSPFGDPVQLTNTGMIQPTGVAVDANGDLYVADSGNARVLRFQSPFNSGVAAGEQANLVLGQPDMFTKITDASSRNMRGPYGLAFTFNGSLLVSDTSDNRVLFFVRPQGGDFTSGQAASTAFGQPDFVTIAGGSTSNRMNGPRGIATDSNDRLFVCDSGNNRVLVYTRVTTAGVDPAPTPPRLPGFNRPLGIYVSQSTGEIWVADTGSNIVDRFPVFDNLVLSNAPIQQFSSNAPAAVTLDAYGNPLVSEGINRVTLYFAALAGANAGSFAPASVGLAPGMLATLAPQGGTFGSATAANSDAQWPTQLGDLQVLVNGTPAPIDYVSPNQINIQIPSSAPTSGTADFLVESQSTGQIYADSNLPMNTSAPSFFTANGLGTGQIAAINQDGTLNSPTNPASRGTVVSLYGTGQGLINGAPPDGTPASGPISASLPLQVIINGPSFIDASNIQYFGLSGFVGVFQLNVTIPQNVPPSNAIPVVITVNDNPSNIGPNGQRIVTTIAVKQ